MTSTSTVFYYWDPTQMTNAMKTSFSTTWRSMQRFGFHTAELPAMTQENITTGNSVVYHVFLSQGTVTTIFNHSLETVCHYVKEVLRAVVALSTRLIRPSENYNDGVEPHRPDLRYSGNTHDARMLARAIHDPEIHFPLLAPRKYYFVDSGFAHRPGYMAPYKESDILYHFQQVDEDAAEVELPNVEDEMQAEIHAPEMQRSEWDRLRDYMAQQP
ncbi:uncharacterized protein LOC111378178 [Olea europaea var. sylvestris]|uniref:uncharacterized protein LOC111378178 n=1 Tax=Olea europaea var. sylvestris TaxID=158386 RepID=UPI000C1CF209|nr:uncharacterized protein LOC111378178 [Olea europaea var. sylvestris]